MERLSKLCAPSRQLLLSQILSYRKHLEMHGGTLEFVHQFMLKVHMNEKVVYVKLNLFDYEFYVFSGEQPIKFFNNFLDVSKWLSDYFSI